MSAHVWIAMTHGDMVLGIYTSYEMAKARLEECCPRWGTEPIEVELDKPVEIS